MPEQHATPPPRPPEPSSPTPSSASLILSIDDAAVLFDGSAQNTDDSPTVISKTPKAAPAPAEDPFAGGLRGRRLAHFELLEPIGVGGMAAVLRARDTQLDRIVALKILPPEMAQDSENIRRFHQEARSAAKLDHENVARVFFCGEDQRLNFIAFEFVEGDNLRTVLERRTRLPYGEALHYMLQIAAGLAHASQRGVVHRDIKPSNIIITPTGRAKLVDMGLARSLEPRPDQDLTQSGVTLGTFDYISPEQALEPREADVRSDIYSLGCTFYHMVTGRPPVPEGTAAKKLHHHQHVKPLDPRELAPGLPDAVAAILDRMLAKDPNQRFQTPEELVHQLLTAARELGTAPETPAGLLAYDAPPPAGGRRPLALAGLAALAVVALVFVIDPTGQPSPQPSVHPPVTHGDEPKPDRAAKQGEEPATTAQVVRPPKPSPPVNPAPTTAVYKDDNPTAAGIAMWAAAEINRGNVNLEILLADDLDLKVLDDGRNPGLRLKAKSVVFKARDAGRPMPVITLSHKAQLQYELWTALTIEAEEATVEGVRFVVAGSGAVVDMTGLQFVGGRLLKVERCEFQQLEPALEGGKRLASVVAESKNGDRPKLMVTGCSFLGFRQAGNFDPTDPGGFNAVVRRAGATLTVENCIFGPHAGVFRFEGRSERGVDGDDVVVRNCSVMATAGTNVFQLATGAEAGLQVADCLVSRPTAAPPEETGRGAVLVGQEGGGQLRFRGADNRYHNLDAYWGGREDFDYTYSDFKSRLSANKGADVGSQVLDVSPWKAADPLVKLGQRPPGEAFQVDEQTAGVWLGVGPKSHVVGAQRAGGVVLARAERPAERRKPPATVVARKPIIFDPKGPADPAGRVYMKFKEALVAAEAGDVILVRHTGELKINPMTLDESAVDLTIKAAPGSRPELTLGEAKALDASLFTLGDGKLRLEGIDFRLRPDAGFRAQSVVSLSGDGQCEFADCSITLDPGKQSTVALAAATLPDAAGAMKTDARPLRNRGPILRFSHCFVRGEGDVIRNRAGRPLELNVDDTLAVLTGSFLNVESAGDGQVGGNVVAVTLSKVTTYLTNHLVRLQAPRDLKTLPVVQCRATGCLFVAAAGRSLVHLDGPETTDAKLREKLTWGGGSNAYGNLKDNMIDQQTVGDEMAMRLPAISSDGWKAMFSTEASSDFPATVKFEQPPAVDVSFAQVTSAQMKPVSLTGYGAQLDAVRRTSGPGAR